MGWCQSGQRVPHSAPTTSGAAWAPQARPQATQGYGAPTAPTCLLVQPPTNSWELLTRPHSKRLWRDPRPGNEGVPEPRRPSPQR